MIEEGKTRLGGLRRPPEDKPPEPPAPAPIPPVFFDCSKCECTPCRCDKDQPWPLRDIVAKLADAAEHLLHDHSCDAHGHEEIERALKRAREWLK